MTYLVQFTRMEAYKAYLDNYGLAITTYERLTRYQPFKKFIDVSDHNFIQIEPFLYQHA